MPDLRLSDDAATRRAGAPLFQGRATLSSSLLKEHNELEIFPSSSRPSCRKDAIAFFRLVRVLIRRSYSAGQFIGARRDTITIVSNHALNGNSSACLIFEAKCHDTVS